MKSVGMNYETAKNHRERISKDMKRCENLLLPGKVTFFSEIKISKLFINAARKEKVQYTSVLYVSIYLLTH